MLENWRYWCRFCAKIDSSDNTLINETNSLKNQVEIVGNFFGIANLSFGGSSYSICTICNDFLRNLEKFKDQCLNANEMFKELMNQDNISDLELRSIRIKYGIDGKDSILPSKVQSKKVLIPEEDTDPLRLELTKNDSENVECSSIRKKRGRPKKSFQELNLTKNETLNVKLENFNKESKDEKSTFVQRDENEFPGHNLESSVALSENVLVVKGNKKTNTNREKFNVCAICSKTYSQKRWLEIHTQKKHNKQENTCKITKKFVCSKCPKHFVNRTRLKFHEITHLPRSERCIIPCPHCDKKLCTKVSLYNHIRNIHTQERPYICEECGKPCVTKSSLKEHKISHSEERTFQCTICSKKFKNQPQLKRHEERHKDCTYKCSNCDVKCSTMANLRLHMVIHSDFHKYKCNYCGKKFKRLKSLKDHLILHAGLRPYECQFCDRTFANASNCLKHKKMSHPAELAAFKASGAPTKTAVVPRIDSLQPNTFLSEFKDRD
ncbi:zinc finger protein 729-like isoform X2 [Phlebotomus papatasi]|uniref:zinc finger protein 729-like isoform X2 n=1 Tax=Phlebotomus papatasi TaxID=29031 RepID=UPI002483DCB5|nr:zinc finger protein 729-like isoform X2 [Phlebotomus papatasi]